MYRDKDLERFCLKKQRISLSFPNDIRVYVRKLLRYSEFPFANGINWLYYIRIGDEHSRSLSVICEQMHLSILHIKI